LQGLKAVFEQRSQVLGYPLSKNLKCTENAAARQKLAELRRMLEGKGG
jgi:hypothetical protein